MIKVTEFKKRFGALWILFDVIKQLSLERCWDEGLMIFKKNW
jgi:hypothetical protein